MGYEIEQCRGAMKAYEDLQLFMPGPVSVPPRILAAGARPMLHHRTPEAAKLIDGVVTKAKILLGTKQDVLLVHTTGRGAMEGTILNLLSPGDEIISVCNGKFGEMYAEIAQIHSVKVHRVCEDWLAPMRLDAVEVALKAYPATKAITVCHNETTTACTNDIRGLAALAHRYGVLIMVDCVSSAGCMPVEVDDWQLDVVVTASQKGLMCPPGLSLVVLSDAAWTAVDQAKGAKFYIQFRDIQKNLHGKRPETPGTTPMSLIASMDEALAMIIEEGKENCYARHDRIGRAIRAGLAAMDVALFPPAADNRSGALTAFKLPAETTAALRSELKSRFGLMVAGGLGKAYKDTVVRVGHMGHVYAKDALLIVAAIEASLHKLSVVKQVGPGVAACSAELTCDN
jgi:aspartate aminotransferase-like enzyme